MDYPNPIEGGQRANLDRDCSTPRPDRRNRNHLRSERSHPNAIVPTGRASPCDANHVHSRPGPARSARRRRVRLAGALPGRTGAAWTETAARAIKPANVATITRITASVEK